MALFGQWNDLSTIRSVSDLLTHFNVDRTVWHAFADQVGDPGEDVRLVAALPRTGLIAGCHHTVLPGGQAITPIQATQIGLVWRLAQRVMAFQSGAAETEFQDCDPWTDSSSSSAPTKTTGSTPNVKEKVLKMSSLIDQGDDSELLPPTATEINQWSKNYMALMGSFPDESEEPSSNQLAALAKRVFQCDSAPYVDFGVWGPYERKLSRANKCRVYTPLGDGSFLQKDLPGPPSYKAWLAAWRVFRTACLMLNVASLAALEAYGRHIERMVVQWPQCWGLVYAADDGARAEKFEKMRRHYSIEASLGRQVPRDWDPLRPWSCIFIQVTKDDAYWSEKVHVPASAWVASGSRGNPVVATEAAVTSNVPGLSMATSEIDEPKDERKRQSNRDRRQARKKRAIAEREELRNLRSHQTSHSSNHTSAQGKGGKGKGKSKSKDQAGMPLCFSWASGTGVCGKLPPGSECQGSVKRAHKCRKCLSPSHQDDACPQ